jgi:uncharacterized protein HemX
MSEVGPLKWIEVGVLVLAGGLFVWWQLRDVRQAQEQSRRQARTAPEADAVDSKEGPRA